MNQLNLDTYNQLCEAYQEVGILSAEDWYSLTYTIFKNAPLSTIDDFWRIVAYAYSWMPTIPRVRSWSIKEPDQLLVRMKELKSGNESTLPELLEELLPIINNSLTGVSKVLHFIAPELVPIIDKNVLRGWEIFFVQRNPQYDVVKLPGFKSLLTARHIPQYLQYRELLLQWVANGEGKFTLRELEAGFFGLGKYFFEPTREEVICPILS